LVGRGAGGWTGTVVAEFTVVHAVGEGWAGDARSWVAS